MKKGLHFWREIEKKNRR